MIEVGGSFQPAQVSEKLKAADNGRLFPFAACAGAASFIAARMAAVKFLKSPAGA
ncbi:MAG TPA: hypothetical protein VK421_02675 [Pyrinomonadaceae bacterium]|nr:hypothetical protein [Pyrinomonadaceae bacterium]